MIDTEQILGLREGILKIGIDTLKELRASYETNYIRNPEHVRLRISQAKAILSGVESLNKVLSTMEKDEVMVKVAELEKKAASLHVK